MGLQTEVAVHQGGVEPEVLKPGLQGRDVVAVHRRAELVRQRARAQPVGRFPQRAVGRLPDDPVDDQSAALLKGPHRVVEFVVEEVQCHLLAGGEVLVGVLQQSQSAKRGPDLDDRTAAVTPAQGIAGRPGRGLRRQHRRGRGRDST